jgi:hypothetical protein
MARAEHGGDAATEEAAAAAASVGGGNGGTDGTTEAPAAPVQHGAGAPGSGPLIIVFDAHLDGQGVVIPWAERLVGTVDEIGASLKVATSPIAQVENGCAIVAAKALSIYDEGLQAGEHLGSIDAQGASAPEHVVAYQAFEVDYRYSVNDRVKTYHNGKRFSGDCSLGETVGRTGIVQRLLTIRGSQTKYVVMFDGDAPLILTLERHQLLPVREEKDGALADQYRDETSFSGLVGFFGGGRQ